MKNSPYLNKNSSEWQSITNQLLMEHPLSNQDILDISTVSWEQLWDTKIGNAIDIDEVELPAPVIGYFFQKLFSNELSKRYPNEWRGEESKQDKDFVNIIEPYNSVEMKMSGQLGYSVFGNRSYNQETNSKSKTKSGFYITLNFYNKKITLLRFGWIDQDDWIPQNSESGQSAKLHKDVYDYKLVEIIGSYMKDNPIQLLNKVGEKTVLYFNENNLYTFEDLIHYRGEDYKVLKVINENQEILNKISKL